MFSFRGSTLVGASVRFGFVGVCPGCGVFVVAGCVVSFGGLWGVVVGNWVWLFLGVGWFWWCWVAVLWCCFLVVVGAGFVRFGCW